MATDWLGSWDVVIAGSGGAALTAALVAADLGGRVLVVERSGHLGGTTAYSGGKVWIPCNHHMRRLGIPDSREAALTYLERVVGADYPDMLAAFVDEAPKMAQYVEEHSSFRFYPCVHYPDYHPEWPGATSGGRALDVEPFEAGSLGDLLPRVRRSPVFLPFTHAEWEQWRFVHRFDWGLLADRIRNNVATVGYALVCGLLKACLDRRVDIWTNTRAIRLVRDGARVTGLEVVRESGAAGHEGPTDVTRIQARRGVIIATGGFEWNGDMKRRFLRGPEAGAASPPWNEGDGLVMGAEIGAQLGNTSEAWWMPLLQIPGEEADGRPLYRALISERGLPGSILVNRAGRRFANEAQNYNDLSKAFHTFDPQRYDWPNIPAWLVFDEKFRSKYSLATVMPGEPVPEWVIRAETPAELARMIGADPAGLSQTIDRFNRLARAGVDEDFHRGESVYDNYYGDPEVGPNPNLAPLEKPPYYAIRVLAGTIGTKGGLVTDARARVLDVRGAIIPGLYACGNVAAFWLGRGYPGPGASIGPGMTFGYVAARDAMGVR